MAQTRFFFGDIPWRRTLAESVAIVVSILLAFAIDAWWDDRGQRLRERDILRGLLADFQASRPGLEARLLLARRMAEGTAGLLEAAALRQEPATISVPDSLVLAVLGGPTYEADTNTLDAALASGEIELLTNEELRGQLATWRRTLVDTREDELEVRRISNEQVMPALAEVIDLSPYYARVLAWSGGDPHAPGRLVASASAPDRPAQTSIRISTELLSALALREFYVQFAAADLEELLATLDRIIVLIEGQLDDRRPRRPRN